MALIRRKREGEPIMNNRAIRFVTIFTIAVIAGAALADEGMWPMYLLDRLAFDQLKTRGLELTAEQIYNPKGGGIADAVVGLGATGSFVSSEGLIVTNHHVAYTAIQEQSTTERNYLRDGFYAPTKTDELQAQGYTANVALGIEDVTKRVLNTVNAKMTALQRYQAIDKITKQIVRETEKTSAVRCKVVSMFGGKEYMKYTSLELRDVRIVYIPPEAIGNYGGETDNWIWPRHTGDFAFFRAYVGPDGKPADFGASNVPYKPKVWLPVSAAGIKEGDFAMTIGFPGSTERYICSYDLANQIAFTYPMGIMTREQEIKIIEDAGAKDSVIALRMASDLKGLYNTLKNSYGTVEGFKNDRILEKKQSEERQLAAFLAKHSELNAKYGRVLPELDSLYVANEKTQLHDYYLGRVGYTSDYIRLASTVYRWAVEREKSDIERERGFQSRDTVNAKRRLKSAQTNLVPEVDKLLTAFAINKLLSLPEDEKVPVIEKLFEGKSGEERDKAVVAYVDNLYANTKIGTLDDRMKMFGMSKKSIEALNDPAVQLAALLYPEMEKIRNRGKEFDGAYSRLAPLLVQALAEWKNGSMYPDANGTMRLSYGEVKGYSPRDAISYNYATTLSGVMQKETGKGEFIVPTELKKTFETKDFGKYALPSGDVPLDFTTTNDITGGNSGSPVLNGKGELIGLAFDGNYEAVASDFLFNKDLARTIAVDIRYVLFIIDRVYHLDNLVKELTIH